MIFDAEKHDALPDITIGGHGLHEVCDLILTQLIRQCLSKSTQFSRSYTTSSDDFKYMCYLCNTILFVSNVLSSLKFKYLVVLKTRKEEF